MHLPCESSRSRLHVFIRIGLMTAASLLVMTQGMGQGVKEDTKKVRPAFGSGGDGVPTGLPASTAIACSNSAR